MKGPLIHVLWEGPAGTDIWYRQDHRGTPAGAEPIEARQSLSRVEVFDWLGSLDDTDMVDIEGEVVPAYRLLDAFSDGAQP